MEVEGVGGTFEAGPVFVYARLAVASISGN